MPVIAGSLQPRHLERPSIESPMLRYHVGGDIGIIAIGDAAMCQESASDEVVAAIRAVAREAIPWQGVQKNFPGSQYCYSTRRSVADIP